MAEAELSLLGIYAHPDDEQIMSGVFAKAAAERIRTGLICATRGEYGEIADPVLATPENLGEVRENELRAAAAVLGIKYLYFLDYKDSGWFDRPENAAPDSFNMADSDEATGSIVKIIREFKPTIVVTFDPTGGYGHLDHVQVYKLAMRAYHEAADPHRYPEAGAPWQAERIYYCSFPRSQMSRFAEMMQEAGVESSFSVVDFKNMGLTDEQITNVVDVSEWVAVKEKSLECHRTQFNPDNPLSRLPADMLIKLRSFEYYALAEGTPMPDTEEARGDLFAGLR